MRGVVTRASAETALTRISAGLRTAPPFAGARLDGGQALDHDAWYRRSLAVADVLAAGLAALLVIGIVGDDSVRPVNLILLPLVVLASKLFGLYDRDELLLRKSSLEDVPRLFQLATLYTLLVWLLEGTTVRGHLGHAQVLVLWSSLLLFTIAARSIARRLATRVMPVERCLLIGGGDTYSEIKTKLATDPRVHATLVGRIPLDDEDLAEMGALGELTDLDRIVPDRNVHRVILAPGSADTEQMLDVIRTVKDLGIKVSLLPRMFEVAGSCVEFDDLGGMIVLGIRRFGLPGSSRRLKRGMDVVGATVALLVASPVLAVIAAAIKLGSRGPVFFRQTRVGRDGARFDMLKFRTMIEEAEDLKGGLREHNEAEGLFKIADDPRITRVGRLLRHTSLDELPQLFNVLRGQMSLVGPRPLVVDEDERLTGWHRRRLHLTPGMTGHWQILGSSRVPLREMVKIDYLYVANWSLWNDVKIMARTVPYVLSRRGL
jgi:exopolysaccharide biosynthesis polyprenyl glycosylphosphotransferase